MNFSSDFLKNIQKDRQVSPYAYLFSICLLLVLLVSMPAVASPSQTIKHALGETVIKGQPVRVISLFQGATDTLVALGIKPIGVVESWSEKPMYKYLRPALTGVHYLALETQPSLEDIALLKPDLIIASRFRNEKTYTLLSQIAPTIALEEVYEFRQTLKIVGQAVGRQQKADLLLKQWDNRIIATRTKLKQQFGDKWPESVSLLEFREDHVRAYSPHSFSGSILSELGFKWSKGTANQQWALQKLVNKESIPIINADNFFIFMRDKPAVQKNYQQWTSHPLWKQMRAAQMKQVYQVDSVSWNLSGGILGANKVLDEVNHTVTHAD